MKFHGIRVDIVRVTGWDSEIVSRILTYLPFHINNIQSGSILVIRVLPMTV
jgi:hypothetical protein